MVHTTQKTTDLAANAVNAVEAKVQPTTTTPQKSIDIDLQAAREHARRLTEMYGINSPEVAVAWDTVEELLTAKARQRERQPNSLEQYCALYPDAPECRVYDV
jgi:hypothetical protein